MCVGCTEVKLWAVCWLGAPDVRFGYIPESPWTTGLIRADIMHPNFKGTIQYEFRADVPATYIANNYNPMDERWGEYVRVSLEHVLQRCPCSTCQRACPADYE